jgi:hypothetical protein
MPLDACEEEEVDAGFAFARTVDVVANARLSSNIAARAVFIVCDVKVQRKNRGLRAESS